MVEDDLDDQPRSLMVKLSVTPPKLRHALTPIENPAMNASPTPKLQDEKPLNGVPQEQVIEMVDAPTSTADEVKVELTSKSEPATVPDNGISAEVAKPAPTEEVATGPAGEVKPTVVKEKTPEPTNGTEAKEEPALTATPLAFRGSLEKPVAAALSQSGVANGEE
jgi:hypothetical protein